MKVSAQKSTLTVGIAVAAFMLATATRNAIAMSTICVTALAVLVILNWRKLATREYRARVLLAVLVGAFTGAGAVFVLAKSLLN